MTKEALNGYVLRPRDGLFLKDGRGWYTTGLGKAYTLDWPQLSTLRGALRTGYGRSLEEPDEVLSPDDWRDKTSSVAIACSLPLRRKTGEVWDARHRMWPVPADALYAEENSRIVRLAPLPKDARPEWPMTLGPLGDEGAKALDWPRIDVSKAAGPPRWWTNRMFVNWCLCKPVQYNARERHRLEPPRRTQAHVGIDPKTRASQRSILFSHDVIEPFARSSEEWGIAVQGSIPRGLETPLTLGGDRRLCDVDPIETDAFEAPAQLLDALHGARRLRLIAATPGQFAQGWLPDAFLWIDGEYRGSLDGVAGDLRLVSAFVPRAEHVSGWEMVPAQSLRRNGSRGQPKPTVRLVPPGSVYFVEKTEERTFTRDEIQSLWLARLSSSPDSGGTLNTERCQQAADEGYGCVVPALWPTEKE